MFEILLIFCVRKKEDEMEKETKVQSISINVWENEKKNVFGGRKKKKENQVSKKSFIY